jgi:sugar lactone lactonase YvrE
MGEGNSENARTHQELMPDDAREPGISLSLPISTGISTMKREHNVALCGTGGRRNLVPGTAGWLVLLVALSLRAAPAEESSISLPDHSFPESVTSTSDGTIYTGSFKNGGVLRAKPGGKAEEFVKPGAGGSRSTLGVLADARSGTLYVCSNDLSAMGVSGPSDSKGASLKTFDLATGAPKGSFALSDPKSFCNDIVVGSDGTAYVTDSFAPNVYRLKPGGTALEIWATDPQLAPAKDGVGLDGIAIGSDGNVYVTTYIPGKLFRIAAKDGKAGDVTELRPSRALDHADAMRTFGDGFLLIEGSGKLDKVTVKGDAADIETIKDGLSEPVSVTQVGNTGWIAEGKLSYLIGPNKEKDPGPFEIKAVTLPK